MTDTYDYIIVGSGSAGGVLANRLSVDGQHSVLLLEFGGSDRSIFIQMPTALSIPMTTEKYNWGYWSDPEPGLDGRTMDCPRGKVLGGSSSINGMAFVRGHAMDYQEWEQSGAQGWGYADVLPYFQRMESWMGAPDAYRANDGLVKVGNGNNRKLSPLYDAFIEAGRQAGYPFTDDYNGFCQEGFGPMHMNVADGRRASAANAYIKPALRRPNLHLRTGAMVERVLFDENKRATGVRLADGSEVKARAEVILSAGSIGSPSILQRSGIGDSSHLSSIGIDTLVHSPRVGANLQDHLEIYFQYECPLPISLNGRLGALSKGWIGARWLLTKTGLGATNHFEACGFIRSDAGVAWPDIQYHFLPAAMRYDGRAAFDGHGFQVHVGPNKPRSRGRVQIKSAGAQDAPSILFNYLTHERDISDWRKTIRLTREVLNQSALEPYRRAEINPGRDIDSDESIDPWVRQNVESAYHPSCTVKIGAEDDPMAPLNRNCQVKGVEGLRVVDSSIFPTIPNGNLNAPSMMVGEKGADIILGKSPLPRSNAPWWQDPQWQTRQRGGGPS